VKRKTPVMTEQIDIQVGAGTYTRRAWADGTVQFYRHDKRRSCLVKLCNRTNSPLIDRIRAQINREAK